MNDNSFYPVPNSIISSMHLRVATYEASVFLPRTADYGGQSPVPEATHGVTRAPAIFGIPTTVFVLAVLLLGAAAADADPANLTNQAVFVRYTNNITFGAAQRAHTDKIVDAAFARFTALQDQVKIERRNLAPILHAATAHQS